MHGGLKYFAPFHYFDHLYYTVQNCNSYLSVQIFLNNWLKCKEEMFVVSFNFPGLFLDL